MRELGDETLCFVLFFLPLSRVCVAVRREEKLCVTQEFVSSFSRINIRECTPIISLAQIT